jgi:succinyl-diaminopimelate desuccinylase
MKEKIYGFIEKSIPLAQELETGLTRRPAVSPDSGGEGEKEKCEFLKQWLREHGIDRLEQHDAPDPKAKGGIRPNLIATIPGREDGPDKPRIWIMSHIDVVPPGDINLWDTDPWTVVRKDDPPLGPRLIGRGVEDNQQGLVSSVLAALSFTEQKITPGFTVKLLFAADEEMGSAYGISWLIKNRRELFRTSDMVLIPDSGDETGSSIEIAEKNLLWAQFTTTGKQTHGAHPDQGINAHLAGADLAVNLHYKLSEKFPAHDPLFDPDYSTFQPTKKAANVPNINTIPGEDVFYMDMRILPQYPVKLVLEEIDRIKAGIEAKHGVSVSYSLAQQMESRPTSANAPLVKRLSRIIEEVYQVKCRPIGIGGGTVGAYLRNEGIDSVVWCRIDHTAHQPNEYTLIANILGDAKVMALLMLGEE